VIPASLCALPVAVLAVSAAEPIPLAPLRIVREDGARVVIELRQDGTIVDVHGNRLGTITGGAVTFDEYSRPVFTVDDAGGVRCAFFASPGRFEDDGALVFESKGERHRMSVDDEGVVVLEDPSGKRESPPFYVSGVSARSRRAAILLAVSLIVLEREGPPARTRRVTLTLDPVQLGGLYFDLVSELRLERRFSLALRAGGGEWMVSNPGATTTPAWELGIEPRWYFVGNFGTGFYLASSTRFAHARLGAVGFDTFHTPPGFSTGALVGFKSVDVPIITPDASFGFLFPIAVPATEVTHPPLAFVVRIGIGVSF
jgi:hypothetical protein